MKKGLIILSSMILIIMIAVYIMYMNKYGGVIHIMTMFRGAKLLKLNKWYGYPAMIAFGVIALYGIFSIPKYIRDKKRK